MDKAFELKPGELGNVPLSLIDPDPEQPRKDFDEDYIKNELAPSIKKHGVIQPIVVRTNPEQPGRFFIVAGENRYRASKVAKVKTIAAVLREVDGLDKLIVQLQENHQRRNLNPMEWAGSLQKMNKVHGLKQADIEKTLKENGVPFGRAYISNMIRLLELPEWAQNLIRNNAITASHGKFLLQAMASEKVTEILREQFEEDGWQPTTTELQQDIYFKFSQMHQNLTQNWITPFDFRTECVKAGCQKMRKVSHPQLSDSTFCLDEACHAVKKAEAKRKQREEREEQHDHDAGSEPSTREIVIDDNNRVDVNQQELQFHRDYRHIEAAGFDTSTCEGCKHRHIAREDDDSEYAADSDSCFLVTCYLQKEDEARRAQRLVAQYLEDRAADKLRNEPGIAARYIAYIFCMSPEVHTGEDGEHIITGYHPDFDFEDDFEDTLFKTGLTSMAAFLKAGDEQVASFAAYAYSTMPQRDVIQLARQLGVTIDNYRIDEYYLTEHTEEELSAILEAMEWAPATLAELYNAQQAGQLDTFIKQHADLIGVPKAIRFAFQQLTQED